MTPAPARPGAFPLLLLPLLILVIVIASALPAGAALIGSPAQLTGGGSWWPRICYNAHSDQYLVGWAQYGGANGVQTTLRRIDASTGDILGDDVVPYPAPRSWKPGLACSSLDHRWLAVYSVEVNLTTGEDDILGRTISSDGSQISGQIDIIRDPGYQNDPILAYNQTNDNYLMVWSNGSSIRGNLIAGDVTPGDPSKIGPLIQISDGTPYNKNEYRVAYNPVVNEFMVVWTDYRNYPPGSTENDNDWGDIYGQRINAATGALIGGNIPIYWGGSPYVRNGMDIPEITCNTTDGRYFIGVTKLSVAGWTTKGLVINYDGTWYSGLFDVSHPSRGSCVGVAHNPSDNSYLMTYLDADYGITARRYSSTGQPVGSAMKVFSMKSLSI